MEFSSTTRWFFGRSCLAKLVSLCELPSVLPRSLSCQSDVEDDDLLEVIPGTTSGIFGGVEIAVWMAVVLGIYVCVWVVGIYAKWMVYLVYPGRLLVSVVPH